MRIQETNEILKEARINRNAVMHQNHADHDGGMMTRAWRMLSSMPHRLTGMFKR